MGFIPAEMSQVCKQSLQLTEKCSRCRAKITQRHCAYTTACEICVFASGFTLTYQISKGEFIPTSFVGVRRLEADAQIPSGRAGPHPRLPRTGSLRATTS